MRPSVIMLQRLMVKIHETWESIRAPAPSGLQAEAGIPATTRSVMVSLDGIMVPLQPPGPIASGRGLAGGVLWHGRVLRQGR